MRDSGFPLCGARQMLSIISAPHSPLPKKPNGFGKLSALSEKRRFRTRGLIIYIIHEKSFELTKLFSVILRATPPLLRDSGFSLFAASFRAHHYRNAANSPSSFTLSIKHKGHEKGSRKSQRAKALRDFWEEEERSAHASFARRAKRECSRLLRRKSVVFAFASVY